MQLAYCCSWHRFPDSVPCETPRKTPCETPRLAARPTPRNVQVMGAMCEPVGHKDRGGTGVGAERSGRVNSRPPLPLSRPLLKTSFTHSQCEIDRGVS